MNRGARDSVAVVLTAPGNAAIAVIRICGRQVESFLSRQFSRRVEAGLCVHGLLSDLRGNIIDDPIITRCRDCVETAAEICLHGGAWVVQATLDLLAQFGFSICDAADIGKPDLRCVAGRSTLDREVRAAIPLAATELSVRSLLQQCAAWELWSSQQQANHAAPLSILQDRGLWWQLNPPRVAIIGKPNVGKSTLANQLFGTHRSVVADLPGTTRDWVDGFADIDGLLIHLIDMPGIRTTDDRIEEEAIRNALPALMDADLIIHVIDASLPAENHDDEINRSVFTNIVRGLPAITLFNKIDLALPSRRWPNDSIAVNARLGTGFDRLKRQILSCFDCVDFDPSLPRWWTQRQQAILLSLAEDGWKSCAFLDHYIGRDGDLANDVLIRHEDEDAYD